MILSMNNKSKNFYFYMGKIFGSREIQKKTNDRFYDDDSKTWYMYFKSNKVITAVSISNNVIKNVWSLSSKELTEVLEKINLDNEINNSIVTNIYENEYVAAGYYIIKTKGNNFLVISGKENE